MVQGVQLSAPFGRYQMAIDVAEAIGPRYGSERGAMATDLIEIDPEQPAAGRASSAPRPRLRKGSVVAIPTDALYTLVADPFNLRAVAQVFARQGPRDAPVAAAAGQRHR